MEDTVICMAKADLDARSSWSGRLRSLLFALELHLLPPRRCRLCSPATAATAASAIVRRAGPCGTATVRRLLIVVLPGLRRSLLRTRVAHGEGRVADGSGRQPRHYRHAAQTLQAAHCRLQCTTLQTHRQGTYILRNERRNDDRGHYACGVGPTQQRLQPCAAGADC